MNNRNSNEHLEISFSGNNIRPEIVKAGEIADIIKAIETLVESKVKELIPGLKKEQIIIGLTNIRAASIDLEFRSPYKEEARSAFQNAGIAIRNRDYTGLSPSAINALKVISKFTRNHLCEASLVYQNGQRDILATITPDTRIEHLHVFKGETTIYAKIIRTGGKEPKVEIDTIDGHTLFCDAPREITKNLGAKLYQNVGLMGIAEWDARLNEITQFSITSVLEYEQKPFKDALKELAEVTHEYYSSVTNVEKHISAERGML